MNEGAGVVVAQTGGEGLNWGHGIRQARGGLMQSDRTWCEGGWSEDPAVEEKLICLHPFLLLKLSSLPAPGFPPASLSSLPITCWCHSRFSWVLSSISWTSALDCTTSWWLPQRCHPAHISAHSSSPRPTYSHQVGNLEMLTHFSCRVNLVLGTTIRKFVPVLEKLQWLWAGLPSSTGAQHEGPLRLGFDPIPAVIYLLTCVPSWITSLDFLIQPNNGYNEKMKPTSKPVLKKVKFHTAPTMRPCSLHSIPKNESRYTLRFLLSIQPL